MTTQKNLERKLNTTFECEGTTLKVVKTENNQVLCKGCYFLDRCKKGFDTPKEAGECLEEIRSDKTNIIFVEVTKNDDMKEKEFNEIIDKIKETSNKKFLARIAHAAMISLCHFVQEKGIISELNLEGGYVSRIDYDLIFPGKEERTDDKTGI